MWAAGQVSDTPGEPSSARADLGWDPGLRVRRRVRAKVAVIIGPPRGHETKGASDHFELRGRRRVEGAVVDLEAGQPGLLKFAQQLDPLGGLAEVGEDRYPPGSDDRRDGVLRPKAASSDIAWSAVADQAREGVLDAGGVTGRHQCPGDRRSSQGVVLAGLERRRPGRRSAVRSREVDRRSGRTGRAARHVAGSGRPRTRRRLDACRSRGCGARLPTAPGRVSRAH